MASSWDFISSADLIVVGGSDLDRFWSIEVWREILHLRKCVISSGQNIKSPLFKFKNMFRDWSFSRGEILTISDDKVWSILRFESRKVFLDESSTVPSEYITKNKKFHAAYGQKNQKFVPSIEQEDDIEYSHQSQKHKRSSF